MIGLSETLGISDNVTASCCIPYDITILVILLLVGSVMTLLLKFNKKIKELEVKSRPAPKKGMFITPYDAFDEGTLQKIVDKLSRNFGILVTIYGFLFTFIISQNFQHVFSKWTVILWAGWVLAIIVKNANVALDLTDIVELAKKNNNSAYAAKKIYAYNRYFRHATFLLILAVAFSPVVFVPLSGNHDSDFAFWQPPSIAIVTIAIGISGVAFLGYYYSDVWDFLRPGIPSMYFFATSIVISQAISHIATSPLDIVKVVVFGTKSDIPQLIFVLFMISPSVIIIAGSFYLRIGRYVSKNRHVQNKI